MPESSSVHNIETTVTTPFGGTYQQRLRSRCSTEWLAAVTMYRFIDKDESSSKAWHLDECRTKAFFIRDIESGKVSVVANHCSLRWCPLCAQAKSSYIRHSVTEWVQTAEHPKFLTLTLRHSAEPLAYQVNKLYGCFRRLRRYSAFNNLVTGGVWFFQLCRNPQRGEWHPHLHCLITGAYIPYQKLRTLWFKLTGGSEVVDIRPVHNVEKVAEYVARYAARPAMLTDLNLKLKIELYHAMRGKRLCGKWGLFTKVELSVKRNPDLKGFERIGTWTTVTEMARSSADARAIIEAYETGQPLPPEISLANVDKDINAYMFGEEVEYTFDKPPPEKSLFDS